MEKVVFDGMTSEQRLDTIKALFDNGAIKKGTYVKAEFKSQKKALKGYEKANGETEVEKYTQGIVRIGINYTHTSEYLERVITDKETPARTSQYDTALSGYENLLIRNEKDGMVRYKVKLYNSKTKSRMKSKWFVNGEEYSKDEIESVVGKQSKGSGNMLTVWLDNLISIGG